MKRRSISTVAVLVFILLVSVELLAQDPNTNKISQSEKTMTNPNDLFEEMLKKAETGDAKSQNEIGWMYCEGQGVLRNNEEAVKWFRRSAEQGYAEAQYGLGNMYLRGRGVPEDYKEACEWFKKSAKQGLAEAQSKFGWMCYEGQGIKQDYKLAFEWSRKSAEQGYALAQNMLGVMYENGEGVQRNYEEAVKWYTESAEQGYAGAQIGLGRMYENGKGVTKDYIQAYKWYILAEAQGRRSFKDSIEDRMTNEEIAEAQRLSKEFKPKTAEQAKAEAENPDKAKVKSNGTGFFITPNGYLITAHHVVKDVAVIQILTDKGLKSAKVVRVDAANDIAVLKIDGIQTTALSVQSSRDVKVGQEIFTLGYPNIQFQGTEAKYTQGNISSLSGIGDDPRLFQISAAVQPGNSGGPLLDAEGQVVGLVVAKLDEIAMAKETGSLPQNVNYALKSSFVLSFLESLPELNGKLLEPKKENLSRTQVVEKTSKAVVMVLCY